MRLLLLGLLLVITTTLTATTYYLDFTNGDDQNDGLSPAAPWKTAGRIRLVPGTVLPGNEYLFKRGEIWRATRFYLPDSGTPGAPLVFGAYGDTADPLPILSAVGELPNANIPSNWVEISTGIWTIQVNRAPARLLIDGAEVLRSSSRDSVGIADNEGATGRWFYTPATMELRLQHGTNPAIAYASISGSIEPTPFQVDGGSHLVITNLELRGGDVAALQVLGGTDISVTSCTIGRYARNGISLNRSSARPVARITVTGNTIDSDFTFYYGNGSERGCGDGLNLFDGVLDCLISNNTIKNWAHNGVELLGDCAGCAGVNDNQIVGNHISAPDIPYAHPLGADGIIDKCRDNLFAYNVLTNCRTASQLNGNNNHVHDNIFQHQRASPSKPQASAHAITLAIYGTGLVCQNNLYEHNLIIDTDEAGFLLRNYGFPGQVTGNVIRNNLIVNTGLAPYDALYPLGTGILLYSTGVSANTFHHNLYFSESGATVGVYQFENGTSSTLTAFNQLNGTNGNIVAGNLDGNPLFTDQNNEDYGLQANSPAIDAGATTALTIDAAQTARPQGGGPDLGPFEYQAPRVFVVELNTWFPSIQAAIDAVPNGTLGTLYIPAGSYPENVNTGAKMIRILFGLP